MENNKFQAIIIGAVTLVVVVLISVAGYLALHKKQPIKPGIETSEQNQKDLGKLNKFANYDQLREFLENRASNNEGAGYGGVMMEKSALDSAAPSGFAPSRGVGESNLALPTQAPSDDYSRTNIQVAGVDEADIIKTDGKYVYSVVDYNLYIVDAYPAEGANIVSKIEFKSRPQDLYISGDRLVVSGGNDQIYALESYKRFKRHSPYTFLKVFDISDKKNPRQIKDLDFEGNYLESRMIGDHVYFMTSTYAQYFDDEIPVPRILDGGQELYNSRSNARCDRCPDVYYFDLPNESYNFINVAAINIKDEKKELKNQVYLMGQSQNIFVSQNNIFLTYTKRISEYELTIAVAKDVVFPHLGDRDRQKILEIEKVDRYILSDSEKLNKINRVIEHYRLSLSDDEEKKLAKEIDEKMKQKYEDLSKELEKTVIHKIAIDKDRLDYKAQGEVTGSVLNQFSMDEHDGYFRIATTKNREWFWRPMMAMEDSVVDSQSRNQESYNNLYVLDKDMKTVGKVEDLATGERIYSVRFMQNRAYLVTFKQMDPLFVIGLENPRAPKVLGQLKIPGYSDYLHPYDEKTLIGLGKQTKENEFGGVVTQGLKLSLFDVSDVSNPKEIDNYVIGDQGSDSIALHDHKAFLFSKEKNLLAIPVTIMNNNLGIQPMVDLPNNPEVSIRSAPVPALGFSGAMVFKVDQNGFELKGKIDHSDGGRRGIQESWYGYDYYDSTVKRSLYISDTLYTFSSRYLQANRLGDLSEIKKLPLKKESDDVRVVN